MMIIQQDGADLLRPNGFISISTTNKQHAIELISYLPISESLRYA